MLGFKTFWSAAKIIAGIETMAPSLRLRILLVLAAGVVGLAHAVDERYPNVKAGKGAARVALVIGNGAYKDSPLKNPPNDAEDIAAALKALGFDVISRRNASQRDMKAAVREFGQKLRGAEAGLFYYAGHGLQVKGGNYLVPVAVDIESEADAEDQGVALDYVMRTMEESGAKFNVSILDACRNNPFARSFRSASRGLASTQAASGMLIAYATAPGSVASDGEGRNGIYTKHLLKNLKEGDSDILKVFQRVRTSVVGETAGRQTPWESTSLVGDFFFRSGQGAQVASLVPVPAAPSGGGVALDDILSQQEAKAKWDKWQAGMKADFDKVAALNAEPGLQITAWDRFLASYKQKSPFGDEDERLRAEARSQRQHLLRPAPTSGATQLVTTSVPQPPANHVDVNAGGCRVFVPQVSLQNNPGGKRLWTGSCNNSVAEGFGTYRIYDAAGRLFNIGQGNMSQGVWQLVQVFFLRDGTLYYNKAGNSGPTRVTSSDVPSWAREIL